MHPPALGRRLAVLLCALLVIGFAVVLRLRPGGEFATRAFDDIGEAVAAGIAAIPCFWRAARSIGRWRASWWFLGAALASWCIGELIWSYYELISSDETPFPSLADAGFLLFPVFALAGLLVRPSSAFAGRVRIRAVLDGIMVAAALFIISWSTALGQVFHAGAQSTFGLVVSLAYPGSDVVLITVAMLVASRAKMTAGLALLVGGLTSMGIADSAFAYLVATGKYGTGAFTDVAWVAAFLAIGLSALFPAAKEHHGTADLDGPITFALPYVFLLAGTLATLIGLIRSIDTPVTFAVQTLAVAALLLRQLIVVLDNRRLTRSVIAQKDELTYRAFHDPLTGLANRSLFYDRVGHALDLHHRDLRPVSVIFVDLDDFKSINDSFGHDAGDVVLIAVANRLRAVMRSGDTIARLGGDEFAVLLEDNGDPAVVTEKLLGALRPPVPVSGRELPVRASIGTTTLDPKQGGADIEQLLKQADLAMYSAKNGGKGTAVRYTPGVVNVAAGKDDLEKRITLSEDVRAGRIGTVFQPIVDTKSGDLFAMEALARWAYRGRPVPPTEFIPLADRGGFLADLDLLVAERALAVASAPECRPHGMIVSINVGLKRMLEHEMPRRLRHMIEQFRISPARLVVEVSEQEILEDDKVVAALEELRDIGVSFAIDDFGVGYSNLSRLELLRPDIVKLDQSFLTPLQTSRGSHLVLRRVIELVHDLGAIVVAEGVETQRQRDVLGDLGCDTVQGFLLGLPAARAIVRTTEEVA